ncbi:MAG: hypothetical protein A2W99_06135 [Bacteroidetes bacterium GWF2_33_16]|nr:MAG: hypothetical protein A2X00_12760 [Bacteroidetes bacterium GWE2_32_14]OFY05261.1 MAG: hypothetical protein A2W99_06135 [Bacteroidetes bacterium GWF2_33_16]
MKRNLLISIILVFLFNVAFSQAPKVKFGKVTEEELTMKYYDRDTSADAVILFDKGELNFFYNNFESPKHFQFEFKRFLRIKIFNKNALNKGNHDIYLRKGNGNRETIKSLKGYTYNYENGKIVKDKISQSDLLNEEYDRNTDIAKCVMPNVREGSIIEIEYSILSDYLYYLQNWVFQYEIPVVWSEFIAVIPEFYNYNMIYTGYYNLDINKTEDKTESFQIQWEEQARIGYGVPERGYYDLESESKRYHLASSNIPAFKEEPFMASTENYIFKIEFELATEKFPNSPMKHYAKSWESIHNELITDDDFGVELNKNINKNLLETLILNSPDDISKMNNIFNYIKNNYKWNNKNRLFVTNSLSQVVKEKTGSCADINLLLVNHLRQAGLTANPVLISTRTNGVVNDIYPGLNKFNYVIASAQIGSTNYLMDATNTYSQPNILPLKCYNGKSFLVGEERFAWIDIQNKNISRNFVTGDFQIGANGELMGEIDFKSSNYFSIDIREKIKEQGSLDKYIDDYKNKNQNLDISEISISGLDTLEAPIQMKYSAEVENSIEKIGDMIYFNPLIYLLDDENPFKNEERKYLIYFNFPTDEIYIINYKLPDGFSVDQLPKPVVLNFLNGSIHFSIMYKQTDNNLQVICKKKIIRTIYMPEEYLGLKDIFNQMTAKQQEKIVLKKAVN